MPGVFVCLGFGFLWVLLAYPLLRVLRLAVSLLQRLTFSNAGVPAQQKVSKRLCPGLRPTRWGSGFLRYGIDPGAASPVCFAAPTLAVYDCVVRSLRSHARIDPVTKPAEGAKDQEPEQKQKPDQKIAAFGSSYSWIRCGHREIGRLSGRLREQARSHKKAKQRSCPRRSRTTQQ